MGKGQSKLNPKDIRDLVLQTNFTEEELKSWYKGFLNVYPNGALMMDDFKKIYGEHFPFGDAAVFAEHVFHMFDTNGDGCIDFGEFIIALGITSNGTIEERLDRAFKMYDIDSNGYISRDEMHEIVGAIYKMVGIANEEKSRKRANEIFDRMDTDFDGKLSVFEFTQGTKGDQELMQLLQIDEQSNIIERRASTTIMNSITSQTPTHTHSSINTRTKWK